MISLVMRILSRRFTGTIMITLEALKVSDTCTCTYRVHVSLKSKNMFKSTSYTVLVCCVVSYM